MADLRQTRFSDVCGTVDDLKRILNEEPWSQQARQTLASYVEDCLFMLERMELRLCEFKELRDKLDTLVGQMRQVGEETRSEAVRAAQEMMRRFRDDSAPSPDEVEQLCAEAEVVRAAASLAEEHLRRFKEASIELGRLYLAIEGGRAWQREGREAEEAGMEAGLAAWLPLSPHRERIMEWLRAGRARILRRDQEPPLLAFEDGGVIALKDARWSEAVNNFVAASSEPSPHGRRYRPKA